MDANERARLHTLATALLGDWTADDLEAFHESAGPAEVIALLDSLGRRDNQFVCLQCGTRVKGDEDACCSSCGRDCLIIVGGELHHGDHFIEQLDALDDARERATALESLLAECRDEIREAWSNVGDYAREKHEDVELMERLSAALTGKEGGG